MWCYKITFGCIKFTTGTTEFLISISTIWGHSYKLYEQHSAHSLFFTGRVVNIWNSLSTQTFHHVLFDI